MDSKKLAVLKRKLTAIMGDISALMEDEANEHDRQIMGMVSFSVNSAYKTLLMAEGILFPARVLKSPKPKPPKPEKTVYGEFGHVQLTEQEYLKLTQRFGDKVIADYIEDVDNYLEDHPKVHYSTHYATILRWLKRDGVKPLEGRSADDGIDDKILQAFMNS